MLQAVVTILVATFLLFVALNAVPGDPVRALFGFQAPPPELYDAIRAQFHLDEPLPKQYALFVSDLARGDLGNSFPRDPFGQPVSGVPIAGQLRAAAPVSARILVSAFLVMLVGGVAAGTAGSVTTDRRVVALVYGAAILAVSIPALVVAFSLQAFVARQTGLFPVLSGYQHWRGYVLPVLAIALPAGAYMTLIAQSELRATLRAPFISAAHANGVRHGRLVRVHALRLALLEVITFAGAHLSQLIAGVVVVEGVFQMPGVGGLILDAIMLQDRSQLLVVVVLLITGIIAVSTLIDLLYAALDPRTTP